MVLISIIGGRRQLPNDPESGYSKSMPEPLKTIGLGGDGDEVDAIHAVEQHFGVLLDRGDAHNWRTAGDVFQSLLKALPADKQDRDVLWYAFAMIMSDETGAQASRIRPDTHLLL